MSEVFQAECNFLKAFKKLAKEVQLIKNDKYVVGYSEAFKSNIGANGISTSSIEFRNYPNLINQMEKKLPTQTKAITPTKEKPQNETTKKEQKIQVNKVTVVIN